MGQLVNDSKEKAQLLVEQFQSVFTRDDDQRLPDTKKRARRPISPLHITANGVENFSAVSIQPKPKDQTGLLTSC